MAKLGDDHFRRLRKRMTLPEDFRQLALDLIEGCTLDNVAEHGTWMKMPACLLARLKANFPHIDCRNMPSTESRDHLAAFVGWSEGSIGEFPLEFWLAKRPEFICLALFGQTIFGHHLFAAVGMSRLCSQSSSSPAVC